VCKLCMIKYRCKSHYNSGKICDNVHPVGSLWCLKHTCKCGREKCDIYKFCPQCYDT
jgi:hypothetical protein